MTVNFPIDGHQAKCEVVDQWKSAVRRRHAQLHSSP